MAGKTVNPTRMELTRLKGKLRTLLEWKAGARGKDNGRAFRMGETSRFQRRDGRWFYVDGEVTL